MRQLRFLSGKPLKINPMVLTSLLQPDLVLGESILSLSPELLCRFNVKGLILDVDDTLVPFCQAETDPALITWMNEMKQLGAVWLVSNNINAYRIKRIANLLDVPYITSAAKPSRRKLQQALEAIDLPANQVAMVGDRLFTDILAGNRLGLFTILVEPMPAQDQPYPNKHSFLRHMETSISQYLGVTLSCSIQSSQSGH
ncbi:MAG: YqeG family HAD IIIA-type phosphatase [Nodosilinea sp.]